LTCKYLITRRAIGTQVALFNLEKNQVRVSEKGIFNLQRTKETQKEKTIQGFNATTNTK